MTKRILVTIQGDYLGRVLSMQANPDGTINVVTERIHIHKAEPVGRLSQSALIKLWETMKEEANKMKASVFLVVANVEYNQKTIIQDDILPILNPDAEAIIVLRTRNWDRLPFEAIGIPSPEEAEQVAKWYTLYSAMKGTLLHYHRELDRLRLELIRFAEYARKLEEHNTELSRLVTELQRKTVDLHAEIQSILSTVENFEKLAETKGKEAKIWRKAYMDVKKKLMSLLDIIPRIIEYANKLATLELDREVEVGALKRDITKLEEKVERTITDVSKIKEEIETLMRKEEIKEEERKKETKAEETSPKKSKKIEEEEIGEEEGSEEFLG